MAPVGLAIAGFLMVALAKWTPAYTNADAYFAARNVLFSRVDHLEDATQASFALQRRYATNKWLYADIGYGLLAWASLAAAVVWLLPVGPRTLSRSTGRVSWIAAATLLALALLAVGGVAGAMHPFRRNQLPPWGDTFIIPIFETGFLMTLLTPIAALLTLGPAVMRAPAGQALFAAPWRRPATIAWSLLYGLPFALCGVAVADAFSAGGWATSIGAAILAWLLLNARALVLARGCHG